MTGIVNYGMGNLKSVYNAIEYLGGRALICNSPADLDKVTKIIVPGVGSFGKCIGNLCEAGFSEKLNEYVLTKGIPTLGICVGMQIMATRGIEGGEYKGLNWFDGEVIRIDSKENSLRIPNIGWTEIELTRPHSLFDKISKKPVVYFVHSYYMKCTHPEDVLATYNYGDRITACILKNNIVATQFHPEKSQDTGLQFLDNFLKWTP
jgi:imidazole glycerol-phosphate synthase subunit HisH